MKSNKKIVYFDKNINRKSDIVKKSLQYFKNTNILKIKAEKSKSKIKQKMINSPKKITKSFNNYKIF